MGLKVCSVLHYSFYSTLGFEFLHQGKKDIHIDYLLVSDFLSTVRYNTLNGVEFLDCLECRCRVNLEFSPFLSRDHSKYHRANAIHDAKFVSDNYYELLEFDFLLPFFL